METEDKLIGETDTKSAYTMRAINGVGLVLEQQAETAHNDVRTRKGVIVGMAACGPLVDKVIVSIQTDIDAGSTSADDARKIIPWLARVRDEITKSVALNQRELAVQEGVIEGLKRAVSTCENLHKQEDAKSKVRQNESDRGNRDEGGRPLPIRETREKPKTQSKKK